MNKTRITIFCFLTGGLPLFWSTALVAEETGSLQPALQRLIENALKNAPNAAVADAEQALRKVAQAHTDFNRFVPGVDIYGTKSMVWPHNRNDWLGIQTFGVQLSFDLQRMFGPESAIAADSEYFGRVQARLERRNIVRLVKNYYTTLYFLKLSISEVTQLETYLANLKTMVAKMRSYGVFVGVEENLLNAEHSVIRHEIIARTAEFNVLLVQLSVLTGETEENLRTLIDPAQYPTRFETTGFSRENLDAMLAAEDQDMFANLSKDYNTLKAEYDNYSTLPMPSVFFRVFTQQNSTSPLLGPNEGGEVGFTYPLGNLVGRKSHQGELKEKLTQTAAVAKKNLVEYRAAIRTTGLHRLALQAELQRLSADRQRMKEFLPKAPALYRQKRIDMSGTLDLMRRYWDTTKLYFSELETVHRLDAELEYLTGSKAP